MSGVLARRSGRCMISEFNEDLSGAWDSANRVIRAAAKVSVFTGAGMSEDSGIPTFRGSGGLWKGRRPEHWATPESFLESPEKVREFYNWRRELISGVNPHPGHLALGRWAMSQSQTVDVITQNVDGFHQQSGCPRVLELHGTLWLQHCHQCQQSEKNLDAVHCCCGGRFRPSVVWFRRISSTGCLAASRRSHREIRCALGRWDFRSRLSRCSPRFLRIGSGLSSRGNQPSACPW